MNAQLFLNSLWEKACGIWFKSQILIKIRRYKHETEIVIVNCFCPNMRIFASIGVGVRKRIFDLRESSFTTEQTRSTQDSTTVTKYVSNAILQEEYARRATMTEKLQKQDSIFVVEATSTPRVINSKVSNDGVVTAEVYEWNWLKYNLDNSEKITDELGFATIHEITMEKIDGQFVVTEDAYTESNTTGYTSSSYEASVAIEDDVAVVEDSATSANTSNQVSSSASSYDPDAAADYADSYVNPDEQLGSQDTSYYNDDYGYISGNDCANYVSQCLEAGGVPYNYGSGKDINSSSQWWFEKDGSVASSCPPPWRSVSYMASYFENEGYSINNATSSNVDKGNPVYVSGHTTICVGYDSNGNGIINSHTNDMYHAPWKWVSTDGLGTGAKTILIA